MSYRVCRVFPSLFFYILFLWKYMIIYFSFQLVFFIFVTFYIFRSPHFKNVFLPCIIIPFLRSLNVFSVWKFVLTTPKNESQSKN